MPKYFNGVSKVCNKCKIDKPVADFGKESRTKHGLKSRCKKCENACYNARYPSFKENKLKRCKERYSEKKEEITAQVKVYYSKNKVDIINQHRVYVSKNKENVNKLARKYHAENIDNNTFYRTSRSYRNLFYRLRISKNSMNTAEILGYTYGQLIEHLGREPIKGEAIDHKIPVSWFSKLDNPKLINHLHNLQILTHTENSKKLNSYSHPVSFEYFELVKDKLKPQYKNKITHYGN